MKNVKYIVKIKCDDTIQIFIFRSMLRKIVLLKHIQRMYDDPDSIEIWMHSNERIVSVMIDILKQYKLLNCNLQRGYSYMLFENVSRETLI